MVSIVLYASSNINLLSDQYLEERKNLRKLKDNSKLHPQVEPVVIYPQRYIFEQEVSSSRPSKVLDWSESQIIMCAPPARKDRVGVRQPWGLVRAHLGVWHHLGLLKKL